MKEEEMGRFRTEVKAEVSDIRAEVSNIKAEVKDMTSATVRHVEKLIAPYTELPTRITTIEQETLKQSGTLEVLEDEAKKAKKARVAARKERLKRAGADENWRKWRKRLVATLSVLIIVGEAYRAWWPREEPRREPARDTAAAPATSTALPLPMN